MEIDEIAKSASRVGRRPTFLLPALTQFERVRVQEIYPSAGEAMPLLYRNYLILLVLNVDLFGKVVP